MLSSCVLYHSDFNYCSWTQTEFDSLRFLYFKFDLFILNHYPSTDSLCWWQKSFPIQRVVAHMNQQAQTQSFHCLDSINSEWTGNFDVFVNFPIKWQKEISFYFPYRTFISLSDVLNSDFIPDVIFHDI